MTKINICQLCLKELDLLKSINIFTEHVTDVTNQTIAMIIAKHFWFEPINKNDCDNKICENCWKVLEIFHNFYQQIQQAHTNLTIPDEIKFIDLNMKFEQENINVIFNEENLNEFYDEEQFCTVDTKDNIEVNPTIIVEQFENLKSAKKKIKKISPDIKRKSTRLSIKNENSLKKMEISQATITKKTKKKTLKIVKNKIKKLETNIKFEDDLVSNYMKLICSICTKDFKTYTELKKHYKSEHNQNGFVVCCESVFYKRCRFIDHIKTHMCPENFRCPTCGKLLKNSKGLTSHNKYMHSEKVRQFDCDIDNCKRIFKNKASLLRHKLNHIPENEWEFKCINCGKCFPSEGVLRTHVTTTHESRYGGICDFCGKKYQNPQDLKRHRLEHDGIREPKAQCEICGDWVSNKYKLKRHMIIHLTGDFKCHLCEKISPNALALKSHIRYTHLKKRTHQCNVCEKVFRRTIDLKEHMTVHTGEALYICPHCPRTFTHHSNMHHHRKKMHRKEFDDDRKNRGERTESWNKVTELKCATTSKGD